MGYTGYLGLKGKTAIVTGGGSNIGRGIVLCLAEEGANIVIADIDEAQAKKTVEKANATGGGGKTVVVKADVTKRDEVDAMVKKTLAEFDNKIDILVNNVGWASVGFFVDHPREISEKEIAINFWGVVNCTQAVLPHMIEKKYGKVVTIASDAGRMGEFKQAVYAGCKGGVIALSKTIAREVGRYGITVNVACPGTTVPEGDEDIGEMSMWRGEAGSIFTPDRLTELAKGYPLRKLGRPKDLGEAVAFLVSDRSGHITGQTLSVSGGYTMI